jgi:tetratricopeptide (TPR) repeat protein
MAADIDERTQFDWFSIARIYETRGEYDEALKAYEESIKIDASYAKAWFHKAKIHYKLKQKKEAKECIKRVLELKPEWERYVKRDFPNL